MIYSIGSEGDQERSWRRRSSDPDRDCGNDRRDVRWLREGPWQKESSQVFATFDAKAIHIWWQFNVHFWIRILSLASNMQQGHFLFPQATIPSQPQPQRWKSLAPTAFCADQLGCWVGSVLNVIQHIVGLLRSSFALNQTASVISLCVCITWVYVFNMTKISI